MQKALVYCWAALIAVTALLADVETAQAGPTLYVREDGDNAADGLTYATAVRSIRLAARRLTNSGGKIIVGPGTYFEGDISPRTAASVSVRTEALEFIADREGNRTGDVPGPVVIEATGKSTGFLLLGQKDVLIDGFHVRHAFDAGIQVRYNSDVRVASENVTIANCVVFANHKRGIDVEDTGGALILNNLVFGNGSTGISVGGGIMGSADALIVHNTSYGNGAHGIFVGDGNQSPVASPNALVLSNIVEGNQTSGIKVAPSSVDTYGSAFNVNEDGFEPITQVDPTDRQAQPMFVNPGCLNEIPGGDECGKEDFRLDLGSAAIDHGPALATELGLTGTTAADGRLDEGTVDGGYHDGNTAVRFVVPAIPLVPLLVRLSGNDSQDGSTPERALGSIRRAASLARAGHRVVVGAGTYLEGDINVEGRSGTRYRPIEFVADIDGSLTGDAGPVLIDASSTSGTGAAGTTPEFQTGFNILGSRYVVIDGFSVTGALDDGIQIRGSTGPDGPQGADNVTVCNSTLFSNHGRGVMVRDSAGAMIFNNLVYANGTGGIAVGGLEIGSRDTRVVNNTVYMNGVHGILVGDRVTEDQHGSPGAVLMNNLLDKNGGRSLLVTPLSLSNYSGAANLDGDLVGDLGLLDPSGADETLGGAGFLDDDFRLEQRRAGQNRTSVAVDRGAAAADLTGVHLGSTRTDQVGDDGLADVGFHYPDSGDRRPTIGKVTPLQARLESPRPRNLKFVDPDGDDGADGRSPASAFLTIGAAARAAVPADMIVVAPGRYQEGDINLARSGQALEPIFFVADTTGKLSGRSPGSVVVDATGYDTGFVLLNRSFVQIRGFHITGAREAAIQVRPCAGEVKNCPTDLGSDHVMVAHNVLFSGERGVDVVNSTDATIFNNLIYANNSTGISITGETRLAANAQLINNTFYRNGGDGILLGGEVGAPNASLINNLLQANRLLGVKTRPQSKQGSVLSHNINTDGASADTPLDPYDPGTSPGFLQPEGLDGILGGNGFADDNFRLRTTKVVKRDRGSRRPKPPGSAAIDRSALDAVDVALTSMAARGDGVQDIGPADLGFHYGVPGPLAGLTKPTVTLFVRAAEGNDANDGLTPETALQTIAAAAARAGAGTTIVIGPGVYVEGNLQPIGSGTAFHPIVFHGDREGTRTGDTAGPVLVDASGAATAFRLAGKSHVRLQGIDVTGARLAGVLAQNTTGLEIVQARIFSNRGAGVLVRRPRGGNSIFNSLVYANRREGLQVRIGRVRDSTLRLIHNTVYANGGRGIWITRPRYLRRMGAVLIGHNVIQLNEDDLLITPGGWNALRLLPNILSRQATGVASEKNVIVTSSVFPKPEGFDGILAGDGFDDDDFRVEEGSSVIDGGAGAAGTWALEQHTVRLDNAADEGVVDLGHHYTR